jgi:hypothetical protein
VVTKNFSIVEVFASFFKKKRFLADFAKGARERRARRNGYLQQVQAQ